MAEQDQQPNGAVREVTPNLAHWRNSLWTPVDGASLAVFRICFGLIMLAEVCRYFITGWIAAYYIEPEFHFT
jgi:vitamin K-dependent gamma-carboxylase